MKRPKFEFSNITSLSLLGTLNILISSCLHFSNPLSIIFLCSSIHLFLHLFRTPSLPLWIFTFFQALFLLLFPLFILPSISQFIFLSPNVSLHFSLSLVLFLFYIPLPPLIHCSIIIPIAVSAPPFIQTNSSPSMLHLPRPLSSLNLFSPS